MNDKVIGKLVATTGSSTLVDVIALLPNGNSLSLQGLKEGTYTIQSVTTKGIGVAGVCQRYHYAQCD